MIQHRGRKNLVDVAEVEDLDLLVLSTGHDEVTLGGDGESVDASVVGLEAVLDAEALVVPDLEVSIPSDGS